MRTSASYTIIEVYDGDQTFVKWGTSSSNTSVPASFGESEPTPQANVFIWRKEGHGLSIASATWGNPICMTGATGAKGDKGNQGPQGPQGIQGPAGADGSSLYTWVAYADDSAGNGISASSSGKAYVGFAYNKTTQSITLTPSLFSWARIEGPQGAPGASGATLYTWLKYADTPTSGMSNLPTGKKYIGLAYNKPTSVESETYSDYQWTLVKGDKGDTGNTGAKGDTGATGSTGASGADAVSADLSISSMQIPVNVSGNVRGARTVECVFSGFKGSSSQTCTATVGTLPSGITASVNNTSRTITFTIAKDGTLGNSLAGLIAVSVTVLGVSFTKKISWVKVVDAQSLQTEIEAQADDITSINGSLSSISTDLAKKAAQTDLVSLQGTVTDNTNSISGLATRVTSSEGKISANATSITNNADAIELKASQTDLNTLNGTVSNHGTQITQTANDITALATRVTNAENTNTTQASQISANASSITTLVTKTDNTNSRLDDAESDISSAQSSIVQNAEAIKLKASKTSVDALTGEVNQNTASITTNAKNITTLVTKTDNTNSRVDDAEGNIATAQSSIRQNADAINLKVSAIGKNGAVINDAKIDVEVTEDGSHIRLDADKVLISGSVKADKIDVADLMARDLVIGNSIHSDRYLADGSINPDSTESSGFYVNAKGKVKAKDADFDSVTISGNSTFSGSVTNTFLKTRPFSDSNESYTLTTTRNWWYESTLYSLISPKGVNSIIGASGSFNGVALSHVLCCNSTGAYISLKATEAIGFGQTKQWASTINGKVSISFDAPSYEYETTTGEWSVSTYETTGISVPESGSRPVNPSDGDTYRTYEVTGGSSQGVHYTVKTYTYHEHTSTKTSRVNCRLLLNGTTEIYHGSSGYRVGIDVSKGSVISLIVGSTSHSLHANGDWKIDIKFDSTGVKFIDTNGTISHVKSSMWYKTPFTLSSPVSTSSSSIAAKFSPNADFFAPNKTPAVMYSLDPSSRIAGKVAVSFMKIDASHVVLQYLDGTSLKALSVASGSMFDEDFRGTIKIANTLGGIDVGTILPIATTDSIGSAEKPFREVRATTVYATTVNATTVKGAVFN